MSYQSSLYDYLSDKYGLDEDPTNEKSIELSW